MDDMFNMNYLPSNIVVSTARVYEIRKDMECSLQRAKRLALGEALENALLNASSVADLRPILALLIEELITNDNRV